LLRDLLDDDDDAETDGMSGSPFALQYEGPAVADGLMSVRELAPALLAFGDLCDQANREIHGDESRVEVKIRAVSPGSVIVNLVVAAAGTGLFGALTAAAKNPKKVAEVLDLVTSAVKFVRESKGKKESVTELLAPSTEVRVTHDVTDRLYGLLKRRAAQEDLIRIVDPLKNEGIDRLNMLQDNKVVESVLSDEVEYFDALPGLIVPELYAVAVPDESVSIVEKPYKVVSLSSDPKNVWRLSDGSSTISVWVTDRTIHERAKEGALGIEPGFVIKARIKSTTHLEDGEPKTRNTLEAVLGIIAPRRGEQPPLL
jgi:hypothetical protein